LGAERVWSELPGIAGSSIVEVAPDERWLVGPGAQQAELLARCQASAAAAGLEALAVDVSDAWSVCTIEGTQADEMWVRLSENPLPSTRPAFVQGALATIPGKAIIEDRRIHCFTPSPLGHHLPRRVLEACADLKPQIQSAGDLTLGGTPRPGMATPLRASTGAAV
jgi:hypothetical protein